MESYTQGHSKQVMVAYQKCTELGSVIGEITCLVDVNRNS